MSSLRTHKFSALYEMASGISSKPEQAGHGTPFLSFSTVFNNYFLPENLTELMNTSAAEQNKYSILKGDIFLTRTSETIDELGMSSVALKDYPNATYSGFLKRLRPIQKDVTYHKFMAFYLRSNMFRKTMTNNAVLTLRASLNEDIFSYLSLILPEYTEQIKIGDLLHFLAQKISLNNRINAELEAMAKALYDYWFVQFDFPNANGKPYKSSGGKMEYNPTLKRSIPAGWEVRELGNKLKTTLGGTPSTKNSIYWDNADICWLNSGEIANFPIVDSEERITKKGIDDSAAELLPKGSVVISIVRHIRVSVLAIDSATNQSVVGMYETDQLKHSFLHPYLSREVSRLMSLRTGAQQPHINKGEVDVSPITIPADQVLERYYQAADTIYKKIMAIAFENQQLTQLRDWLLPMLMNGQVKISTK